MLTKVSTPDQAVQQWEQSQAYKDIANYEATKAVYPVAYNQLRAQGLSENAARQSALTVASEAGENAVASKQNNLLPLALASLLLVSA